MTSVSHRGRESMAVALKLAAELAEVVDLAVEDDADRAVLVRDRRIAVLEVDDREPVLANRAPTVYEDALSIRAAVALTRKLCTDCLLGRRPRLAHEPGNPTHAGLPASGDRVSAHVTVA